MKYSAVLLLVNFPQASIKTGIQKIIFLAIVFYSYAANAQTHPEPEFANEVYFLKKESTPLLLRLEKNNAKQESKTKLGGFAGVEYGYTIEGQKSSVRFSSGNQLSFVYSIGTTASNPKMDSALRANGMDPGMLSTMRFDPAKMITLYKTNSDKDRRKIYLAKNSGAFGGKNKSSDKYDVSIKKIKEGYWELAVDKPLSSGEYAFVVMSYNTDGSHTLFAFGID